MKKFEFKNRFKAAVFFTALMFVQSETNAQGCLTNSLTVTSGIDDRWEVTALSTNLAAETTDVPPYPAYPVSVDASSYTCQPDNYINFLNTSGHANSPNNGANAENMVVTRSFRTCQDDTLRIQLSFGADNNATGWVDALTPFITQAGTCSRTNFQNCANINYTVFLPAGDHTLNFRVFDCSQTDPEVIDAMGISIVGTISSVTSTNSLVQQSEECEDYVCGGGCSDSCFWKVSGNNIIDGNNIFGTLTNDDVKIKTNNLDRGIFTKTGLLGWHTSNPTAYLHVDCSGNNLQGASDIRFQNLEVNPNGTVLVIDQLGYVYNSSQPLGSKNNCTTTNMLPKTTSSTGTMGCSQVFDNGTSVGIGLTSGFTYSWSGSGLYGGTTVPPTSGNIRLGVNGVTRSLGYIATSDGRLKRNVKAIEKPLDLITRLEGKTYNWSPETIKETGADDSRQYGFVAQEVAKVLPEAVIVDEEGNYGINYNFFIPLLNEGQKELYTMYQNTLRENEAIKADLQELKQQVEALRNCCNSNDDQQSVATVKNVLYQNTPNPFEKETRVEFLIQSMQSAYIGLYDLNGREIAKYPIQQAGRGSINVDAVNMISGMYIYSLVVDGQLIDSKKMVLAK